jgi:hypothetical protein
MMTEPTDFEQDTDDTPDELLPLSVAVDMLEDVVKMLNEVDDLVTQHRRAAGDDHHALEQLQHATMRINQAWGSVVSARKVLRGKRVQ